MIHECLMQPVVTGLFAKSGLGGIPEQNGSRIQSGLWIYSK